jgi:single-strand DNA-binding protein
MTTRLSITGNLAADPELKFTKDGKAVASFRVADTARKKDNQTGEWSDGATLWVRVTLWGREGEAFAEHARKGDRVTAAGRLIASEWVGTDGEKRSGLELTADTAGIVPKPQYREQQQSEAAPF